MTEFQNAAKMALLKLNDSIFCDDDRNTTKARIC